MIIRKFQSNDLDACIAIFIKSFSPPPWSENWSYRTAYNYLTSNISNPSFLGIVALEDEKILGMLFAQKKQWWDGHEIHIDEMCVSPGSQGQGVGTKLLDYVMENFVDVSVKYIRLWTHSNSLAYKFYKKHGFYAVQSVALMEKTV